MKTDLPLFQHDELSRLQERRNALLKRVQTLPKHSHSREQKIGELKAITAQAIELEIELYRNLPNQKLHN